LLFLYGEREQDLIAQHARFIERAIPNGRRRAVPDAGHFSHVDNPEYVVKSIRKFLSTFE